MPKHAYHHGNLRPALIKAALRAIADEGPDKFTLRDVARRAGVSAPAVYRHFESKDDLLAAVAADAAERLGAMMVEAVTHAPEDPIERFRATGIAYVKFAVAHPEHFRALNLPGIVQRTPTEPMSRQQAWQADERVRLAAARAAGQTSQLSVDEILLSASALVHGLAHMIVEGQLGDVDEKRAVELALIVTRAIGVGFLPRSEDLVDPRGNVAIKASPKPTTSWVRAPAS